MAKQPPKSRGLGRGLSALMSDVEPEQRPVAPQMAASASERYVPIEQIYPNPDQPRRHFDPDDLNDLSNSIKTKGVIQPLIVREHPNQKDGFEIVAGERRWRAAQMAQLHQVPVVVRSLDDQSVLEIAIIENIQRADLNPIEEAIGYRQLMDRFGHTQEKLADALGKSRSYIANLLRLLNLPVPVQAMVTDGRLSAGHARALITADDPVALAEKVVGQGLSVRATEKLAQAAQDPKPKPSAPKVEKDADTKALEGDLSATLKMQVRINHKPGGEGGEVTVRYNSLEQLDDLCRLLGG
ncbi:MAG: ParB/RepB/Spo0J family partition protein [Pseudomonadota bacterium]